MVEQINHAQSVAILIDGNNIGMSINNAYSPGAMLNFELVVPKILNGRGLNRLIYMREGRNKLMAAKSINLTAMPATG